MAEGERGSRRAINIGLSLLSVSRFPREHTLNGSSFWYNPVPGWVSLEPSAGRVTGAILKGTPPGEGWRQHGMGCISVRFCLVDWEDQGGGAATGGGFTLRRGSERGEIGQKIQMK